MREVELPSGAEVKVEEAGELDNDAGAVVWDAALVLSHYLIHSSEQAGPGAHQVQVQGKSVLELGAGTGLVGLVASALGAAPVVLTDLPHLLPFLDRNIKLNADSFPALKVQSAALEWGNATQVTSVLKLLMHSIAASSPGKPSAAAMHPDIILASDVIYQVQHLEELCFTLSLLCGQQTVVVLAFEERPGMEGWRDTANAHGLREEKIPTSSLHPDWRSEDISVFLLRKPE